MLGETISGEVLAQLGHFHHLNLEGLGVVNTQSVRLPLVLEHDVVMVTYTLDNGYS